jgi:alkylated DNA repair protein (DNA oxidative demethylase)
MPPRLLAAFAAIAPAAPSPQACLINVYDSAARMGLHQDRDTSGDAMSLGGAGRLAFHGVDRITAGSSTLLPRGGRINLTLRRVTKP